jgi:hypothetical protein
MWGFFVCVHKKQDVNSAIIQIMCCIFCHNNLFNASNIKTQSTKYVISYYKVNGITILKKDVGAIHFVIAKNIEEEVNSPLRENVKRQLVRKGLKYFAMLFQTKLL